MLHQPASSQPGFVRGTVALLENFIIVRITEHHKEMEVITQQLYVPNRTHLLSTLSNRNRDSSLHAAHFQSLTLQSLSSLAQERHTGQSRTLSNCTLMARRLQKPIP
ncbi:hypothetical protein TNCV_3366431 [Trichonephila clavipes]|nr:hypothetical protein TNCV_3366431 [Trichonephila clavipes]